MSFDWSDFLSLASALSSQPDIPGPPEAALRSAASRAYYAAFHSALTLARTEGFVPTYTGKDHFSIRDYFRSHNPTSSQRRKIAVELERLYDLRRVADYRASLNRPPSSLASHALGMANRIIAILNSL